MEGCRGKLDLGLGEGRFVRFVVRRHHGSDLQILDQIRIVNGVARAPDNEKGEAKCGRK